MENTAPYISQKTLNRKINNNKDEENIEIIDSFKNTEIYLENKEKQNDSNQKFIPKIYEIFEEIENNNDIHSEEDKKVTQKH